MEQPKVIFHGAHHQVLNHTITTLEILEQSNLHTLHFNQQPQDNPIKTPTCSVLKETLKLFRSQQRSRKISNKEPNILSQDLTFQVMMTQPPNRKMVLYIMQCLQEKKIIGKVTFSPMLNQILQLEKSWEEPIMVEEDSMEIVMDQIIGKRKQIQQEI